MKKIYSLLFICLATIVQAQNAVPNGSFEQWTTATHETPQYYVQSSNTEAFFRSNAPFNCVKTTDSYHGLYALKLTTVVGSDTLMGYVLNANPGDGDPCQWKGGIPYNQQPTGIKGYYKSNIMPGDSAGILLVFKGGGSCNFYLYKFGGVQSTYVPFSFNFSPAMSFIPDTVIFGAVSSDVFNDVQKPGSMIQLDSLAFTGVGSQPAYFNGDFETWQTNTIKSPDDWYLNTDGQGLGVSQTTDAYQGTYAVQLTTYLGDNKGIPLARGGEVSTGYYVCPSGSGNCVEKGGFPFSNMVDTLAFYYKYIPSGNDSAAVQLNFKKNGVQTWSTGISLHAAANYTYMEIPFNIGTAPDSVIVGFRSSSWNDTLVSFVGSTLKVDEIHFKSQPLSTGIKNLEKNKSISVYPNPSLNGIFQVNNIGVKDVISVYNILGERVNATIKRNIDSAFVDISPNAEGVYFIQVNSEGKIFAEKIIVSKYNNF